MNARNICDCLQQKMPALLARHKDPIASVTTVLNRLVEYGEAQPVISNGRRAWLWIAEYRRRLQWHTTNPAWLPASLV